MSNDYCTKQRHCDGFEMHEGYNIYCTKHFLSESANNQIKDLESQLTAQTEEIERLHEKLEAYETLGFEIVEPTANEGESALIKNGCKPGCYLTLFETLEQRDIVGTIHASDCPNNEGEG